MNLPRRRVLRLAAGATALSAVPRFVWAQTYPSRPIHLIIGFTPGAATDVIGRFFAKAAFDLIELNGDDLRRDPLAVRKATLASLVAHAAPGLRLNEHLDHDDGALVFEHACRLGLERIVSKRRDSPSRCSLRH